MPALRALIQFQHRSTNLSTWIALALSVCMGSSQLGAAGVTEVTATPDFVYIRGETRSTKVRVLERDPWEAGDLPRRTEPLTRITAPARFEFAVPRYAEGRDRLYSAFQCVEELPDGGVRTLGSRRFVSVFRGVSRNREPFPPSRSKKGLQVQMLDDALALGIGHAALNFNLAQLVDVHQRPDSLSWESSGQTFRFRSDYLRSMDQQVKPLSDAGVIVSLILLVYQSSDPQLDQVLLHPLYDPACPNRLGAFNTVTPQGAQTYIAALEFLADRYNTPQYPHGRVANFIIGNEVNSHWFWSNRGRCTMEEFAEDYLGAVRMANTAVRKASSSARVYLSLEHHWNIRYPGGDPGQAFAGKGFLDYFHRRAQEEGDFDWHLAFHPYPENLFECRTWKDQSAHTNAETPRITFKNVEQITRYLAAPGWQYVPPPNESYSFPNRRVILSEQGFHAPDGSEGELWQAAAYAYAYRKIAHNPGIDSFILHRHVDHAHEGGLRLGLWTRKPNSVADPDRPRRMYDVFKRADQPDWANAFEFALPVIGLQSWEDLRLP